MRGHQVVFVVPWCVLCLRDSCDCLVVMLSLLHVLSMRFRNGQRWFPSSEEGFLDPWQGSSRRSFGKMRSRLMGERVGHANSAQNRMCGRGGVAGNVTITSRRGCTESTGRRSLLSRESGLQVFRRRVERKTEKLEAPKLRRRNSEQGLMPWRRRKEYKGGQVSLLQKKGTRKTCGEIAWKSRMRPSVAENWMNRGKRCRRSYERSTDRPLFPRKCRRASRSHCSTSCKMWRKGSHAWAPQGAKEDAKDTKPPGQKKIF